MINKEMMEITRQKSIDALSDYLWDSLRNEDLDTLKKFKRWSLALSDTDTGDIFKRSLTEAIAWLEEITALNTTEQTAQAEYNATGRVSDAEIIFPNV
jgi:hypothetical protein